MTTWGIGLTDVAKLASGVDKRLRAADFDELGFKKRLEAVRPAVIAFNGKNAAAVVFGCVTHCIDYGPQSPSIIGAQVFVLPSTSGSARKYWDA